jgi:hypothetical protein
MGGVFRKSDKKEARSTRVQRRRLLLQAPAQPSHGLPAADLLRTRLALSLRGRRSVLHAGGSPYSRDHSPLEKRRRRDADGDPAKRFLEERETVNGGFVIRVGMPRDYRCPCTRRWRSYRHDRQTSSGTAPRLMKCTMIQWRRAQPATRLQRELGFDTIMQLNQKLGIPNEPSE